MYYVYVLLLSKISPMLRIFFKRLAYRAKNSVRKLIITDTTIAKIGHQFHEIHTSWETVRCQSRVICLIKPLFPLLIEMFA